MCRPQFPIGGSFGNGNSIPFDQQSIVFPDQLDNIIAQNRQFNHFPPNSQSNIPYPNNPFLQNSQPNPIQNNPPSTNWFEMNPFSTNQQGSNPFPNNPFFQSIGPQQFPQQNQQPSGQQSNQSPSQWPFQQPTRQPQWTTTPRPITAAPNPMTTKSPQFFNCYHNCTTTGQYNPVCGSDGESYHNDQKLQCTNNCGRRVSSDWRGESREYVVRQCSMIICRYIMISIFFLCTEVRLVRMGLCRPRGWSTAVDTTHCKPCSIEWTSYMINKWNRNLF